MTSALASRARWRRAALLLLLGAPLAAGAAPAQSPDRGVDGRWWAGAAALLGGAVLLDEELRSLATDGGGLAWDPLADRLNPVGNPRYLVPALASGWAAGKLAGAPRLSSASTHILAALVAGGVANGATKSVVGRQRPVGGDPLSFRPFSLDNRWQSFPSGHTVVVFSVAGAVAEEADRGWVTAVSYGTAAMVGWSRVYEDKHWTSDVVGGALIGVAASRAALGVIHRHHPHGARTEPAQLLVHPRGLAVRIPTR